MSIFNLVSVLSTGGDSGNPFNQSLNTNDSPIFASLSVSNIKDSGNNNSIGIDSRTLYSLNGNSIASWSNSGFSLASPLLSNGLVGTSGQVLTSNGEGLIPTWKTFSGGEGGNPFDQDLNTFNTVAFSGTKVVDFAFEPSTITQDVTDLNDYGSYIEYSGSADASVVMKSNSVDLASGTTQYINNPTGYTVTITRREGEGFFYTDNGAIDTYILSPFSSVTFVNSSGNWNLISKTGNSPSPPAVLSSIFTHNGSDASPDEGEFYYDNELLYLYINIKDYYGQNWSATLETLSHQGNGTVMVMISDPSSNFYISGIATFQSTDFSVYQFYFNELYLVNGEIEFSSNSANIIIYPSPQYIFPDQKVDTNSNVVFSSINVVFPDTGASVLNIFGENNATIQPGDISGTDGRDIDILGGNAVPLDVELLQGGDVNIAGGAGTDSDIARKGLVYINGALFTPGDSDSQASLSQIKNLTVDGTSIFGELITVQNTIEFTNSNNPIILTASDNSRWYVGVDDTGTLFTVQES